MRIAQVVRHLGRGGAERVAVDLASELVERGHDVSVIVLNGEAQNELAQELYGINGINLVLCRGGRLISALRANTIILSSSFDVVHTHLGAINYVFPSILLGRTALIHTLHNIPEHISTLREGKILKSLIRRKKVLPCILSSSFQEDFRKIFGKGSVRVVPNGMNFTRLDKTFTEDVSATRARLGLPSNAFMILLVGRAEPQKAVESAIDLLGELSPNMYLVLALSGGSRLEQLRERIASSSMRDRIILALNHAKFLFLLKRSQMNKQGKSGCLLLLTPPLVS